MTSDKDNCSTTILVAVDIAKLRNEVLIAQSSKTRRKRLRINNTDEDLKRLVNHLQSLGGSVQIGFEATGNYHRPLAWRLLEAGSESHLISSIALARTRETLHNGWDKNDPKDAKVMLHILRVGNTQRCIMIHLVSATHGYPPSAQRAGQPLQQP